MRYSVFISTTLIFLLMGCSEPTIDTSTNESMTKSIDKIKDRLNEQEASKFDEALQTIALNNIDFSSILSSDNASNIEETMLKNSSSELNGKTYEQVLDRANSIRLELEKKQIEQAILEIKELEEKQNKAELAKSSLEKFRISRSRYYQNDNSLFSTGVIEFTIQNDSDSAISKVHMKGTYATQGRSVPWVVDDFSYSISGGLEPGEKQSISIYAPYTFDNVEVRNDAILTIDVTRVDGPSGDAIYNAEGLNEYEKERLAELKLKYQTQEETN